MEVLPATLVKGVVAPPLTVAQRENQQTCLSVCVRHWAFGSFSTPALMKLGQWNIYAKDVFEELLELHSLHVRNSSARS